LEAHYQGERLKEATELERELMLAEYPPLREEVNRTIDRMTTNEFACTGFVFSVILLLLTQKVDSRVTPEIICVLGALLATVVAFLGEQRSSVFRRHMDQVDAYLREVELTFSEKWGWTGHYNRTMAASDMARQIGTRKTLWHVLKFCSLLHLAFQCFVPFFSA
jgi:hypothetical protein